MKFHRLSITTTTAAAAVCSLLFSVAPGAFAAGPTEYQVTGPITSVTDTSIVVLKGKESFDIARSADTKAPADMKVGDKVTVHYTMSATAVEAKPAKAPAAAPKPAKASKKDAAAPAPSASPAKPAAEAPAASPSA